jgi:hypothetical protein
VFNPDRKDHHWGKRKNASNNITVNVQGGLPNFPVTNGAIAGNTAPNNNMQPTSFMNAIVKV